MDEAFYRKQAKKYLSVNAVMANPEGARWLIQQMFEDYSYLRRRARHTVEILAPMIKAAEPVLRDLDEAAI